MTFFARAKGPAASVAYSINYTDDLGSGETITASIWSVTNGTEASKSNTASTTTIRISGGSLVKPIIARNIVTTSNNQTLRRTVTVPVDPT